jgi:23S rRNA (pseudouridine1915-N3)-methyltransferase
MKLRVIWIGKTKDPHLAALASDFTTRIKRFLPIEITELKESRIEADKILGTLDSSDRVVVLDDKGVSWTSAQLAAFVGKHMNKDPRRLTFIIGGHTGLAEAVKKRADQALSLSPLTFTHDMTRVLLLEQIYRALTIIHNHPYPR